ncbi:MAG: type II toxin-antitoxin system HipA family toxin [Microbacteriaceae bacterium]
MVTELVVYLDGERCGSVEQTQTGNVTFTYSDDYRMRPGATPLSLSMPLAAATHKKRAILPFLQGLLPDSEEALNAIARRYGISSRSPFALLKHVGADVAGAVQIVAPEMESSDAVGKRGKSRAVDESEIGKMLRQVLDEYAEGVPFIGSVGNFSLAGAQPKIALFKSKQGRWAVPEGATPTTHIFKPVAGTVRRIDVVEQMTMSAARMLGCNVASSTLQTIDGLDVFVTERYDRKLEAGRWRRLHQEDFCQALSVPPDKKYQHRDGGPGLAKIAELIRSLPFESDRQEVGRDFYRAFVFNVVAGCTDAHAKNYSLMLQGESVRLAPLYDLVTYAPYWDGRARLDTAMSVGGEYALERISVQKLVAAGKQFGVGHDAEELVQTMRAGVIHAFATARTQLNSSAREVKKIADELMAGLERMPLVQS